MPKFKGTKSKAFSRETVAGGCCSCLKPDTLPSLCPVYGVTRFVFALVGVDLVGGGGLGCLELTNGHSLQNLCGRA